MVDRIQLSPGVRDKLGAKGTRFLGLKAIFSYNARDRVIQSLIPSNETALVDALPVTPTQFNAICEGVITESGYATATEITHAARHCPHLF